MTRLALIALPLLLAACAAGPGAPAAPVAQASGCEQLAAELSSAETERHLAPEQKDKAWKAVIPFAVAARYAKSKSAAEEAEQRIDSLRQQAAAQGCATTQGS